MKRRDLLKSVRMVAEVHCALDATLLGTGLTL
jgi:hypothetical protein